MKESQTPGKSLILAATDLPEAPPEILRRGIGGGDFWSVGRETAVLVEELCGPLSGARILDIGCGLGRVGYFLSRAIGDGGTYLGFDTHPMYIPWCRDHLGLDAPRCRFEHVDLASSTYNREGAGTAEEFQFPWQPGGFDLAVATSLFTHLQAAGTANYARQAYRMLRPGGRLFATFFVLAPSTLAALDRGETHLNFEHPTETGRVLSLEDPEGGVAFMESWLQQLLLADVGFALEHYLEGSWRSAGGRFFQDVVVLRKPAS
jgi:SAM-dependent methyltransferase